MRNTFINLLILLLCCLAAFWPLTFHVFSLKNDALNYFLPVRYQISEAIRNGYLPLWSPYLNLGYPLHGDMQSGAWNPVVYLFSLFGPYNLKTLQNETLLYIYLSGTGMYFLVQHICRDGRISLLAGVSFMLSGFITDSCQFLNWIAAASFLPFIVLFYYRTLMERNWKTAMAAGIFMYLLFTTAYPADFILTAYLLFAVLVWHLVRKKVKIREASSIAGLHGLILFCFIVLSLPAILSYAEFLPLSERGGGASYEQAMSNPLHPGLILSYIAPLSAHVAPFATITDPLTRNSFVGLVTIVLFLTGISIKLTHPLGRFLKWAFLVSLVFSLGESGGLRIISYYLLPLMKSFRHPSNARLFTIFFSCLVASLALQQLLLGKAHRPQRKTVMVAVMASLVILLIWSLQGTFHISSPSGMTVSQLKSFKDSLHFSDTLLIDLILQLPFLTAIYFWYVRKLEIRWLLVAGITNSILYALIFQPFTVVKKDSVAYIQSRVQSIEKPGYPVPDIRATIAQNSLNGMDWFDEIGTSNLFNKKIGRVDYRITPSNLLTQNQFWHDERLRSCFIGYPLFYQADTIVNIADSANWLCLNKKLLVLERRTDLTYLNRDLSKSAILKTFSPRKWEFEVSGGPAFYSLFQNHYPRWKLFLDGKPWPIEKCNISFMGFTVPPGRHSVSMIYETRDLKIASIISITGLLVILSLMFFHKPRQAGPAA